jgi:hypothetical protein
LDSCLGSQLADQPAKDAGWELASSNTLVEPYLLRLHCARLLASDYGLPVGWRAGRCRQKRSHLAKGSRLLLGSRGLCSAPAGVVGPLAKYTCAASEPQPSSRSGRLAGGRSGCVLVEDDTSLDGRTLFSSKAQPLVFCGVCGLAVGPISVPSKSRASDRLHVRRSTTGLPAPQLQPRNGELFWANFRRCDGLLEWPAWRRALWQPTGT